VRTRWAADPSAALAAEVDGDLVGTNFVTRWGSVGFFGPPTVAPSSGTATWHGPCSMRPWRSSTSGECRRGAYRQLLYRGYRPDFIGVTLHQPDLDAYHHPDAYVIDDWR
jgi:hypothetical protein